MDYKVPPHQKYTDSGHMLDFKLKTYDRSITTTRRRINEFC
jgi:hypothetical protein